MRRFKKKYKRPKRPWDKQRLAEEREIMKKYGLRRKHELWRMEEILRKYRRLARRLAAVKDKEKEKVLIQKLAKLGLLKPGATLDDVLSLTVEDVLERRLQTIVFKKGFANTIKQARQLIVHGHVYVNGIRTVYPSYLVNKDEENKITVDINVVKESKGEVNVEGEKAATEA